MLKALIGTAPGKKGDRDAETEVTRRAWHEGMQERN